MRNFQFILILILVYNYSVITAQTGETCPSSSEISLVANQTGSGSTTLRSRIVGLDLVYVGAPSQSRSSFFGQDQDEVQQDDFASRPTALAMQRLLAACKSQTIVLFKLWGLVGRRERPHLQEEAVQGSGLELGCMGGTISQKAHEQFKQKEKQLNPRQGQRKGQRQRQREGCDQRDATFSFCQDDHAGGSSYHSLSCSHNTSYAAGSTIGKQRAAVCHPESFPGQSDDATRDQGCHGAHGESGFKATDSRSASSHHQYGQSPEDSERVNGLERKTPASMAPASCGVTERMATAVGKLRCQTGRVCEMHPKSQKRHGVCPCLDPNAQCQGGREDTASAPRSNSGGYGTRHESHQGSRGKESQKTAPFALGQLCDQNGCETPREHGANSGIVRRGEGWQKGKKATSHIACQAKRWAILTILAFSQGRYHGHNWHLRTGSALTCLKKAERVPWEGRSVRFDGDVNAYAVEDFQRHAAYSLQPQFENLFNSMQSICEHHTVVYDQDYVSPLDAIRRAQKLHISCIDDDCESSRSRHQPCLKPHVTDLWCAEGVSAMSEPCLQTRLLDQRHSETSVHGEDRLPEDHEGHPDRDAITEGATSLSFDESEQLNHLLDSFREAGVDEIILVSYGLYAASVGTRRATAPPDEGSIRAAIIETWIDYFVGEASAVLHMVRPQEFLANIEIHFIIEFGNRIIPLPRGDIPILRRTTWHEVWHDAEPVASYVSQHLSPPEVIVRCGLSEWCNVHTRTTCNLHVEKRICLPLVPVQLLPGSLIEIFIHFNAVEDDDESSLFQQSADSNMLHGGMQAEQWPESTIS